MDKDILDSISLSYRPMRRLWECKNMKKTKLMFMSGNPCKLWDWGTCECVIIPQRGASCSEISEFINFIERRIPDVEFTEVCKKEKPKPLKDEIMDLLEGIDQSKYDMQNKILKQKQHIKELETRIKHLKNDVKNNQRSINSLSRKCDLCNYKTDYEFKEYENKCLKSEISNLKREKEAYRKMIVAIQNEIDTTDVYFADGLIIYNIKKILEYKK